MAEECNVASLKDVGKGFQFDKLMLRLACDAENFEASQHFVVATECRYVHMVEACVAQVAQIQDMYYDEAIPYVAGIIRQAGYTIIASGPEYRLDLSAQQLLALFQMLDTHRRRLLRAAGWKTRMGFDPKIAYARILFLGDERVVTTDAQPGQIYIHVKRKTSA